MIHNTPTTTAVNTMSVYMCMIVVCVYICMITSSSVSAEILTASSSSSSSSSSTGIYLERGSEAEIAWRESMHDYLVSNNIVDTPNASHDMIVSLLQTALEKGYLEHALNQAKYHINSLQTDETHKAQQVLETADKEHADNDNALLQLFENRKYNTQSQKDTVTCSPLPSSLFPLPSSLFPLPSSLFPLPSSLTFSPSHLLPLSLSPSILCLYSATECPRYDGRTCNGPKSGKCAGGKCTCVGGWSGVACQTDPEMQQYNPVTGIAEPNKGCEDQLKSYQQDC
jgi:hypothetical protein